MGGGGNREVILRLYTKSKCPTMPATGLKDCVGGRGAVCKHILVFSFIQAEQFGF